MNTIADLNALYAERHRRMLVNQKSGNVWVTKEGKVIAIEDMTDDHLNNTIKMMEDIEARNEERRRAEFQDYINGLTEEERQELIRYII